MAVGAESAFPRHRLFICEEPDVVAAQLRARELALEEGFSRGAAGAIATAVSEVARNIIVHAGCGEILLSVTLERSRRAILVIAKDQCPGIADVERAMQDGFSTKGGLGLGLPSAKRLMDEFALASAVGEGTTVTMRKWTDVPDR
ncbi:MAG TPA: anti-sigma regulatory factor [Anaeromyxobacteraceae bacterium]|nr:anti-sigma regulatory factor [Anaeromyxobacteraceae bacterium]